MKSGRTFALVLLSTMAFVASGPTASTADLDRKDGSGGGSGDSPHINSFILRYGDTARPLLKIGAMQAWAIADETGKLVLALTTEDGLTVIGKVIGPQGENISGALLAMTPDQELEKALTTSAPGESEDPTTIPDQEGAQHSNIMERLRQAKSASKGSTPSVQRRVASAPPLAAFTANAPSSDVTASVTPNATAITAVGQPTPQIQAALDQLLEEATSERLWFSAAKANPDAPVIYMLTDPDCPHCRWAIDSLHSKITSGQIDLRIIPAPITGPGGFTSALSIVHSDDVAKTFMNHMTSNTRGTPAVTQMDAKTADKAVIQAIAENINWMRRNRIGSVPFFFYKDATGAKFSASALPDNILQVAKTF